MKKFLTTATTVVGLLALGLWLAPAARAAEDSAAPAEMTTLAGTIQKLDLEAHSMTIKGLLLSKTFQIADDAVIATSAKPQAALSDLRVGDQVKVSYQDHNGVLMAHRIELAATTTPSSGGTGPAKDSSAPRTSPNQQPNPGY